VPVGASVGTAGSGTDVPAAPPIASAGDAGSGLKPA